MQIPVRAAPAQAGLVPPLRACAESLHSSIIFIACITNSYFWHVCQPAGCWALVRQNKPEHLLRTRRGLGEALAVLGVNLNDFTDGKTGRHQRPSLEFSTCNGLQWDAG